MKIDEMLGAVGLSRRDIVIVLLIVLAVCLAAYWATGVPIRSTEAIGTLIGVSVVYALIKILVSRWRRGRQ